jgi:predicted membrane GTPase involved in stress response
VVGEEGAELVGPACQREKDVGHEAGLGLGLEDALEYIGDDELVEVTPKSVRIRKMILDEVEVRRIA